MSASLNAKADATAVADLETKLDQRISLLESSIKNLTEQPPILDTNSQSQSTYASVLTSGAQAQHPTPLDFAVAVKEQVKEEVSEMRQIEIRKNNLMLYRVPEGAEAPVAQKAVWDNQHVVKLFQTLTNSTRSPKIVDVRRLGKHMAPDHSRPILVKFEQFEDKRNMILNAYKLKNVKGSLEGVSLSADMTQKQRAANNILRSELKLRKEAGEKDLVIRRGQITTRIPTPNPEVELLVPETTPIVTST